ncbi:MAG: M48 family metallopeptidase [Opitutaceae bacterium]
MKRLTSWTFALALLASAGCYTNPVTGRKSVVLIPPSQELELGQQSFAEMKKAEKVSNDPAMNARVQRVGQRIAKVVGEQLPNAQWEFVVFDSKDANAFALPGGKVGVYTGLLQIAESDSELATVIGHEIGHVIARHGAERMTEGIALAGLGVVSGLVLDNNTDPQTRNLVLGAFGAGATLGIVLPHSRSNETEADRMGVVFAARAGYDPRAAISFWQKMTRQGEAAGKAGAKTPGLLSTHPSDTKRISDLQALMPEVVPVYEKNRSQFPQ